MSNFTAGSLAPQGEPLSAQAQAQVRLLEQLDTNQIQLTRLFAALPTFDRVTGNLLVSALKAQFPGKKLHPSLPDAIDPDDCFVNHFTTDPAGARSLTSSETFTSVMHSSLLSDTAPVFANTGVGFFTLPDSLDEADSVFADPLDKQTLRAMESVFHIPQPTTNEQVKRQFRNELALFRHKENGGDVLGLNIPLSTEAALAQLFSRRFAHLFQLYKVDRDPAAQLSQSERIQQSEEDRLLDIITTHPSQADRSRLLRAPVPHVYAVMLDMGTAAQQAWPAAMVIKFTDRPSLFLYSLEYGLQRFDSFHNLVDHVRPSVQGQERTILDICVELSGHVFEVAAADLLQRQSAALDTALNAPGNETVAVRVFAQRAEDALGLPMLSLAGPMIARQETLVENRRPGFYKMATFAGQARYRRLEGQVFQAVYALGSDIPTLVQFTRQKIRQYLQRTIHPRLDLDPDQTMIRLSFGDAANPRQSRVSSLTQLMLDNLRPPQYPNAMREVLAINLVDRHGQRVRHPASGFLITLNGGELARMASNIDAGGSYEILLREQMNQPRYKAAWQAAYRASLEFKGYEALLKGDEVFKTAVMDEVSYPPTSQKLVARWLEAVLQAPSAAKRAPVGGRRVHVHGLLLGGTAGLQPGTIGNAVTIDGALVFSDQSGPDIKGTVGVYFPDSPHGNDLHEFADLSDGVTALLQQEEWRTYFRSRISTLDQEEINRALGQHRGRPLIRGYLITDDVLETLHRAHVNFHSAYADHRSNSNRDIGLQTAARIMMMVVEIVMDLAGLLLIPGFQLLTRAIRTGLLVVKTGGVPRDLATLVFVHTVANTRKQAGFGGVSVNLRGQTSFRAITAQQNQAQASFGLPLEEALYRRYAVADTTLVQSLPADAQGFYRPVITDGATGSVTRPVFVRQPDGTVFRVHDNTPIRATEANIVDPVTGLNIRSSGVMRSTVARAPDGEWRAVGFGMGGGKRSRPGSPEPGPSAPKQPATSSLRAVSDLIRTPNQWDVEIMDLVPSIITRLPNWPQNRSLLIIDQRRGHQDWSVRFTPGQDETGYPMRSHPLRASTDVVLVRTGENHYTLMLDESNEVLFPADGNCFFNAVARGLNEGPVQRRFTMQRLRNEIADYIDQHPEMGHYLVAQPTAVQQALAYNAPALEHLLGESAVLDLTRIVYGSPNPQGLFQPVLNRLNLYAQDMARRYLNQAQGANLPPEMLRLIGSYLSPRTPVRLPLSSTPFYSLKDQALRVFFEDTLLGPVLNQEVTELLNNEYLMLSQDVLHIMLEYGVRARELTDHHPRNHLGYVEYDRAVHGNLTEEQLEESLNGALLVDHDDLSRMKKRYEHETGNAMDDPADLLDQFIYYDRAEDLVDLFTVVLGRYPILLRRANILLQSSVIASNLGGLLPLNVVSQWIRTPALSDARLQLIAEYAGSRYQEVATRGRIDIDWMRPFDDQNLRSLFNQRYPLLKFFTFLGGIRYIEDSDLSAIARLFSVPQPPSNSRMAILFDTPNIWGALRNMPGATLQSARGIWEDLIGPQFTDESIRFALGRADSLSSEAAFSQALIDSLVEEEALAHQLIMDAYVVTQRQAQHFLHNFQFTNQRADHSRLTLARYVNLNGEIPQWAWPYARPGVNDVTLAGFMERRKPSKS
ncbi:OTU domain-containing protein [Pseudomonas sp. RGM2987]|uniref:OTU domain-containing protein n=1 Tax=Pseudomonas sp. RGM2987 TaxID=2930090 RepID=UPI001FD71512|nr:OTU domain-containing protein [Pseudomonas sp. RGM2987]MCJ8205762.1 OTU family ubiquitin thioesterase [Pseudomonas sp. RGM2987]